ncbi:hypothetical protein IAU60_006840 [Kwoniella sp. DSM 27419]
MFSPAPLHTPYGTASLRRSASLNKQFSAKDAHASNKRSSVYLTGQSPNPRLSLSSPNKDSTDETTALKRSLESSNRVNQSLRTRIAELEQHVEHATGPEVERLAKELSTLEDLFAQTQRDNETKHAEAERQKVYVKALEDLLAANLGDDWRSSNHLFPPSSSVPLVTPSTPLPKPRTPAAHTLRHSVSFSSNRPLVHKHRRASSVMDLRLAGLQSVKEDDVGMDDTPTGAMRRLNGMTACQQGPGLACSADLQVPRVLIRDAMGQEAVKSPNPSVQLVTPGEILVATKQDPQPLGILDVDHDRLNTVLCLLTSSDLLDALVKLTKEADVPINKPQCLSPDAPAPAVMIERLLMEQKERLERREQELQVLVQVAREKERALGV